MLHEVLIIVIHATIGEIDSERKNMMMEDEGMMMETWVTEKWRMELMRAGIVVCVVVVVVMVVVVDVVVLGASLLMVVNAFRSRLLVGRSWLLSVGWEFYDNI